MEKILNIIKKSYKSIIKNSYKFDSLFELSVFYITILFLNLLFNYFNSGESNFNLTIMFCSLLVGIIYITKYFFNKYSYTINLVVSLLTYLLFVFILNIYMYSTKDLIIYSLIPFIFNLNIFNYVKNKFNFDFLNKIYLKDNNITNKLIIDENNIINSKNENFIKPNIDVYTNNMNINFEKVEFYKEIRNLLNFFEYYNLNNEHEKVSEYKNKGTFLIHSNIILLIFTHFISINHKLMNFFIKKDKSNNDVILTIYFENNNKNGFLNFENFENLIYQNFNQNEDYDLKISKSSKSENIVKILLRFVKK